MNDNHFFYKIKTAHDLLEEAQILLDDRALDYDSPGGERSMSSCVNAFNAITGKNLTEPEGYLLLQILKDVRQWQQPSRCHLDSLIDCISYASLKAEAIINEANKRNEQKQASK